MRRIFLWELLILGLLASPPIVAALFLYSQWGLLTVEVIPRDQPSIPVPHSGQMVEVYGTWVRDTGHSLGNSGWNEIHPAVFLRNLDTGDEGGEAKCSLLGGVLGPGRLRILDQAEPCKWARGKVQFVFVFTGDGDLHIDLRLEPQNQNLANMGPPLIPIPYPVLRPLVSVLVLGFGISYLAITLYKPSNTVLGRTMLKLFRENTGSKLE